MLDGCWPTKTGPYRHDAAEDDRPRLPQSRGRRVRIPYTADYKPGMPGDSCAIDGRNRVAMRSADHRSFVGQPLGMRRIRWADSASRSFGIAYRLWPAHTAYVTLQ